jgi:GNAT superfamily N-acetyltransferase
VATAGDSKRKKPPLFDMEIRNLKDTPLAEIVACISESFANYFVQLPSEESYWENRFKGARVDYELSYGCFENGRLTGFIINGIDRENGKMVAFNTGTGVTQESRGKKVIDRLYEYAVPHLKNAGVERCKLEVIEANEIAVHVYERIGFDCTKRIRCYQGHLEVPESKADVRRSSLQEIETTMQQYNDHYSWDHTLEALRTYGDQYEVYIVSLDGADIGYFIINPAREYLAQIELYNEDAVHWQNMLAAVRNQSPYIRLLNVDERRTALLAALRKAGLENYINQLEMEMPIA